MTDPQERLSVGEVLGRARAALERGEITEKDYDHLYEIALNLTGPIPGSSMFNAEWRPTPKQRRALLARENSLKAK